MTQLRSILGEIIHRWEPRPRPQCSNCIHARVRGLQDEPEPYCRFDHGRERSHAQLCRQSHPLGFMPAERCDDWEPAG